MHANAAENIEETENILSTSDVNISVDVTPEFIRPFRKASPRKREAVIKKSKTRILTDAPEKSRLQLELEKNGKQCRQKSD